MNGEDAVTASEEGSETRVTGKPARRLTTHQQAVLIQVLLTFGDEPVGVCYRAGASEARQYAEDFLMIFKAINWQVEELETAEASSMAAGSLSIVVKGNPPPSAEALRDALRIYRIEAPIVRDAAGLCASRHFALVVT